MERIDQILVVAYETTIFSLLNDLKDAFTTNEELTSQIHKLKSDVRRLNKERKDLTAAYKEAVAGRKAEEERARKMATELGQFWKRANRRIREKDEEIETIRKQNRIEFERLNSRYIEAETKLKTEIIRIDKKLLLQTTELQLSLVDANTHNSDLQKAVQKHSLKTELEQTVVHLQEQQEIYVKVEAIRDSLEIEFKNIFARLGEVAANAIDGGKRIIAELEARIKILELEKNEEKRRHSNTIRILRKSERQLENVMIQCEFDEEYIRRLENIYKRQLNEQRVVSQKSVTRVRRFQRELERAEVGDNAAGSSLSRNRAKDGTSVTNSTKPG